MNHRRALRYTPLTIVVMSGRAGLTNMYYYIKGDFYSETDSEKERLYDD